MQKKRTAQFGSISLQLVLCSAAVCLMISGTLLAFFRSEAPLEVSPAALTLADRVAYQRAIEDVYWRHRIWPRNPGERPDPKPSLEAVMSQAQIERKVTDYLRKSQALEDYWQRPITADQLQAEMDRLAKRTRQPEVLHDLFEALGNDPFVIAECLSRPVLAERLFESAMASQDATFAANQPIDRRKADGAPFSGYTLPRLATALEREGTCIDAWAATSTGNAPTAREWHTAVWTGTEMIVWGGWGNYLNTGGKYNPATDSWTVTSTTNAPAPRARHTAVWTGTEMVIWGGIDPNYLDTGGRYNPITDTWVATSTTNAPSARLLHTAVWTGTEMIVWGGKDVSELPSNTGGRYNPSTDSWTSTSTTNAPSARYYHTGVWTGSEMIVWGGEDFSGAFNTGGKYNPATNTWTATSTTNAPDPRIVHTAVWTGNEMIIWGGDTVVEVNTGGRYNPGGDTWLPTSLTNAPTRRAGHTAVWSGSEMIVWGGYDGFDSVNTGARYNPGTDSWVATSTIIAPTARDEHTAVWTGSEMLVWAGIDASGLVNTGGRYCGDYGPTPTPTATATATPTPTPTASPTASGTPSPPTVITVTNTNDGGPGSLRQALIDANDFDIINFAVTGTIGLTSGELLVNKVLTISGPGPESLAVNGNAKSRVFHVSHPGGNVAISGLTITNGHASGSFPNDSGGGIYNDQARLTLDNCAIDGNYAAHWGSGIYNDGHAGGFASLEINNSSVRSNSGDNAIYNDADLVGAASTAITNSTLSDNVGDAIHSAACGSPHGGSPQVQVISSTISGNSGGAIFNDCFSLASVSNSTISGNSGGVHNIWSMGIGNSTFSNNSGTNIYNDTFFGQPALMDVGSTVLNASASQPNIVNHGMIHSNGYSVLSDDGGGYLNGPGDQINTDPMLGPLQDNGGPTFTHALLPGSPAIDAGNPGFVPPPYYDQRGPGFDRVRNGRIDTGSFEVQAGPIGTPTATPTVTATATPMSRATPTPRSRPTPPARP
jgi:hypothetical protein